MRGARLYAVNYEDPEAVRKAHEAITHMGLPDGFLDWTRKSEALGCLGELILYEHAAVERAEFWSILYATVSKYSRRAGYAIA